MKSVKAVILFAALFISACNPHKLPVPGENEALIGETLFKPVFNSALISEGKIMLEFSDGTNTVSIVTNDTVQGIYNISEETLKATALLANISYENGTNTWNGTSGTVTIGQNGDLIEGTYEAVLLSSDETEIEISSGSFDGIEMEVDPGNGLINSKEVIMDSLEACIDHMKGFAELQYIFDAVYSNDAPAPSSVWNEVYNHSLSSTNNQVRLLWNHAWGIVKLSNILIESSFEVITDSITKYQVNAQAEVCRSYAYFYLMKWFGDVPYITSAVATVSQVRLAEEDICTDLMERLNLAVEYLPVASSDSPQGWYTVACAKELIVNFSLNLKAYQIALETGQDIIYSNQYSLSAETGNFEADNPEIYCGFNLIANSDFQAIFDKGSYIPFFRLTGTYLECAEAGLNTEQAVEAANYLNQIRMRRLEDPISEISSDDIYQQFRKEVSAEGSVFSIMKRFAKAEDELQIMSFRLLLPIPESALENNSLLTQNPGY